MEGAINLSVPLQVKMKKGLSWGSLVDYTPMQPQAFIGLQGRNSSEKSAIMVKRGESVVRDIFGRDD